MYVNLWAFEKVNFQINVFTIFVIIEKMVLIFFFFILSFAIQECILFKSKNLYRLRFLKILSLSYDNALLEPCLTLLILHLKWSKYLEGPRIKKTRYRTQAM